MKHRLLILFFLLFAFASGYSQQRKTYTIGMLSDSYSEDMAPLVKKLQEQIKAVVGQEADIHFEDQYMRSSQLDLEKARQNFEAFEQNPNINIIMAFGPIHNYLLMQKKDFIKPVVLFGTINQDFINLPKGKKTSGINNLTYLITPESITQDLETFRELYPYQNIGIILDDYMIDLFPVQEVLDREFADKDCQYTLLPLRAKVINGLVEELDKVDAVYLGSGTYRDAQEYQSLIRKINQKKLPSFSAMGKDSATSGVLFTHSSSYHSDNFFRRIGLTIEAIVMGKAPEQLPILIDYKKKLTLNGETALHIDFPLKYSQLLSMEVVGDIKKFPFTKKYSLPEVLNQVLEKNYSLLGQKQGVAISKKELSLARSNYLPNLTTSAQSVYIDPEIAKVSNGSNPEFSTSGNITLEQVLYSEEASANIAIQKELAQASEQNFNADQLDAVLNGSMAYFNALISKTNFIIQDENLRVTRKNYEIANQNYSAGQSGKSDVLRWKSELAQATQNIVLAQNNMHQSLHALNETLSNPIDLKIDVEDANLSEGVFEKYDYERVFKVIDDPILRVKFVKFLINEAKTNAPELKALEHNINAAKRTSALYLRSKFLPTLALQGQYNHTFTRKGEGSTYPQGFTAPPDGYYNVALNLSLPIFQRNQRSLNRQKSKLQEEQLKYQKESIELSLERNVNDIISSLATQITNIEFSKISAEAAKESLELTQIGYSNGAVSITSLIDAQRAYIQAQQQQANASYNYLLNFLQLERIISHFFMLNTTEQNQAFANRFFQYSLIQQGDQ
jgi:outer membrane protein TolC/ABC-type uncharacterized transport system substrate-binding protein